MLAVRVLRQHYKMRPVTTVACDLVANCDVFY